MKCASRNTDRWLLAAILTGWIIAQMVCKPVVFQVALPEISVLGEQLRKIYTDAWIFIGHTLFNLQFYGAMSLKCFAV